MNVPKYINYDLEGSIFMPRGSKKISNMRKDEIINACASLYETMGFRDITIRDIGNRTTFSRTSIYNYFQTKEEIFLALLQREHQAWADDLESIANENESLTAEEFADKVARSLEKRGYMLKLMCMNLYDMECSSRIENLVSFKLAYANTLKVLTHCLEKFFPDMASDDIQKFIYAFFPFLFGVYPYTSTTEKQKEAMEIANIDYIEHTVYEIVKPFIMKIL